MGHADLSVRDAAIITAPAYGELAGAAPTAEWGHSPETPPRPSPQGSDPAPGLQEHLGEKELGEPDSKEMRFSGDIKT